MPMDLESFYPPEPEEEEANPVLAEDALLGTPEEKSLTNIVMGVLGSLEP